MTFNDLKFELFVKFDFEWYAYCIHYAVEAVLIPRTYKIGKNTGYLGCPWMDSLSDGRIEFSGSELP